MCQTKVCRACHRDKTLLEFHADKTRPDGRFPYCRECSREKDRARYLAEADRRRRAAKAWARDNRDAHRQKTRKWCRKNPDKCRALARRKRASRRAAQLRASPAWSDRAAIAAIYLSAQEQGLHVDHIVPLVSPVVCGLHVAVNLKPLPALENISKGNRWWPDMWDYSS